jgi:hypothetical protein
MPGMPAAAGLPPGAMDALAGPGGGAGQAQTGPSPDALVGQIRDIDQAVQALGTAVPAASAEVQQIRQALKRLIVKVSQSVSTGPPASAAALPTGGV